MSLEDTLKAKAAKIEAQLTGAKLQDVITHFKAKTAARWGSRRFLLTVLPILAAVFFLRGHMTELLTVVVPAAVTLLKWYLITTCVTDGISTICETWNNNKLAEHVIGDSPI